MAPRAPKAAKLSKDEKETVAALKELKADPKPLKQRATNKKHEEIKKTIMNDSDLRARLKKKVIDSRAADTVDHVPRRPRKRLPSAGECAAVKTSQTKSKKANTTRVKRV